MSECHRYPKPTVVQKDLSYIVTLLSAYQKYLVVFQFMVLQVVERAPVTVTFGSVYSTASFFSFIFSLTMLVILKTRRLVKLPKFNHC